MNSDKMYKICPLCNASFKVKPSHYDRRKYCTKICFDTDRQTFESRNCIICDKGFKFYSSAKGSVGKYCSLRCKGIDFKYPDIINICLLCNCSFKASLNFKNKKFCSIKCYANSMKGKEKISFWDSAPLEKRIERLKKSYEKFVIKNENLCWGWKGSLSKIYGSLQYGGKYKSISAHRASWIIHYGEILNNLWVLHKCDNPACTNPEHLFLGTPSDNVKDMINKKRNNTPKGENCPQSKLKENEVKEIRILLERNHTLQEISEKYNVDIITIFDIKHKKTWKHLK